MPMVEAGDELIWFYEYNSGSDLSDLNGNPIFKWSTSSCTQVDKWPNM